MAKMRDVLSNGTSLVFVSHDLQSVESICRRGMWLRDGITEADGPVAETLSYYRQAVERRAEEEIVGDGPIHLAGLELAGAGGDLHRTFEPLEVRLRLDATRARMGNVVVGVTEGTANPLILERQQVEFREGENVVTCRLARLPLPRGRFFVWVAVYWDGWPLLRWHPAGHVDVIGPDLPSVPPGIMRQSRIMVESSWEATADGQELIRGDGKRAVP
jgi:hypothetical protein